MPLYLQRYVRTPTVYSLASKPNCVLYTGVTSDLCGRMSEHVDGTYESFSKRYALKTLVYSEVHLDMNATVTREKRVKAWKRAWKVHLISGYNPEWRDLYDHNNGEISAGPADAARER